jgi:hypothetical protein
MLSAHTFAILMGLKASPRDSMRINIPHSNAFPNKVTGCTRNLGAKRVVLYTVQGQSKSQVRLVENPQPQPVKIEGWRDQESWSER